MSQQDPLAANSSGTTAQAHTARAGGADCAARATTLHMVAVSTAACSTTPQRTARTNTAQNTRPRPRRTLAAAPQLSANCQEVAT